MKKTTKILGWIFSVWIFLGGFISFFELVSHYKGSRLVELAVFIPSLLIMLLSAIFIKKILLRRDHRTVNEEIQNNVRKFKITLPAIFMMILGSVFVVSGVITILSPIYKNESQGYNFFVSIGAIVLGGLIIYKIIKSKGDF